MMRLIKLLLVVELVVSGVLFVNATTAHARSGLRLCSFLDSSVVPILLVSSNVTCSEAWNTVVAGAWTSRVPTEDFHTCGVTTSAPPCKPFRCPGNEKTNGMAPRIVSCFRNSGRQRIVFIQLRTTICGVYELIPFQAGVGHPIIDSSADCDTGASAMKQFILAYTYKVHPASYKEESLGWATMSMKGWKCAGGTSGTTHYSASCWDGANTVSFESGA